jgi:hypothetical protein
VQRSGLHAMLWVYSKSKAFWQGSHALSIAQTRKNGKSKTDSKSEAREIKTLAEVAAEIEPFARNAAKEGNSMREFKRGLLDMLLRAGYPGINLFLEHQGDGDQGTTVTG